MIDTVALLLADRSPSLRYRVLLEVDGVEPRDPEVVALSKELPASLEVARVVSSVEGSDDARGMSFALSRLAYLGLTRGHGPIDALAHQLFALQRKDGSWPFRSWTAGGRDKGYDWIPLQTALPLRGLAEAGFATDERSERAYDWLLAHRLEDGSWPTGHASGQKGYVAGYRRLPRSEGCRSNTTGALACFAHHPERRASAEARAALDLLLQRETRDEWALGFEVARLLGYEQPRGFMTFYARFDLAFLLAMATRMGASRADGRVADLVDFLEARRGPHGLWEHPSHPHLSRWLTFDLLASLRRLESGDWAGRDLHVPFRAYPKRRQRY